MYCNGQSRQVCHCIENVTIHSTAQKCTMSGGDNNLLCCDMIYGFVCGCKGDATDGNFGGKIDCALSKWTIVEL